MGMFDFTDDQELVRANAAEFATQRLGPTVLARDHAGTFDRELVDEMLQMGFAGLCLPEEYGGSGGDFISYVAAVEEISRIDDGLGITLSVTVSLAANPILEFGTPQQKEKYLVPLAEGSKLGAFGLTEPRAGTDSAAQQTTARLEGDHYVLNGSKVFITNAGEAEIYIVFAMTDKTAGNKGITAFILEKGTPGFTFGKTEDKLGIHTSVTKELLFSDVSLPVDQRLGAEGQGFKVAMRTLDGGRIGVAAQALGIASGAYEAARSYAKERVQFGKPIATHEAISFKLADMATRIDAARLLVYRAAAYKQAGRPFAMEAAMAKMFASDTAMDVAVDAVQIFGGYGYS